MMNLTKMTPKPNPFTLFSLGFNTSTTQRSLRRCYVFEDITTLDEAVTLFQRMFLMQPMPPIWDFNRLLNIVVRMKHYSQALTMFKKLYYLGCPLDSYTMNIGINCYCNIENVDLGFATVGCFLKRGYVPDVVSYTTLFNGLCKCRRWGEADKLLRGMVAGDGIYPNLTTFNALVNAYCKEGLMEYAEQLVKVMAGRGMEPDMVTYTALMKGYCLQGQPGKAEELLNLMAEKGLEADLVSYCTVLNGYCKCNYIDDAWKMFNEMSLKGMSIDTAMYNCMIQGLLSVGRCSQALDLFDEMKVVGLGCNIYTYGIVLDGLFKNGKIEDAALLYYEVDSKGLAEHVGFYNTFIHGLCNNNQLDLARSIFKNLSTKGLYPNVITYNVMMQGLCQKGMLQEAEALLNKMEKSGCFPDRLTYNIITQACLKHYDRVDSLNILRQIARKVPMLDASTFAIALQQLLGVDKDPGRTRLIQLLISNDTRSVMV